MNLVEQQVCGDVRMKVYDQLATTRHQYNNVEKQLWDRMGELVWPVFGMMVEELNEVS